MAASNILTQLQNSEENGGETELAESESSSEISDETKRRRTRTNFTQWQINELEKAFRYKKQWQGKKLSRDLLT